MSDPEFPPRAWIDATLIEDYPECAVSLITGHPWMDEYISIEEHNFICSQIRSRFEAKDRAEKALQEIEEIAGDE